MTTVLVEDLHVHPDPAGAIRDAAVDAAQGPAPHRILVRCPEKHSGGTRALRADDIAGLLRRHGVLSEIGVTEGGTILAAADLRTRRGELAVWTGQAIGPWDPSDIVQRGLGGSETAAVRLAEQFAGMGYVVTLYGHFGQRHLAADVELRHFSEFDPTRHLDALIGFRDARLFEERPNATFCALWLEDLAPAEMLTPKRAGNVDKICGVTHWHKGQIEREYSWLDPEQVVGCRNGIVTEWFDEEAGLERSPRVVYSSSPDRGGDVVLECWPAIKERVPDAELILTYPRWFELCAGMWLQASDHLERIRELVDQPGVTRIEGGIGQKDLAHLMKASTVWVNPGYHTPGANKFDETSCISAMEAQAAGCVVVASNWGAVTETVVHGTLLDGDPGEKDGSWRRTFVDAVVAGLTDPDVQQAGQTLGPEAMKDMDWRGAAEPLAGWIWQACGKKARR